MNGERVDLQIEIIEVVFIHVDHLTEVPLEDPVDHPLEDPVEAL